MSFPDEIWQQIFEIVRDVDSGPRDTEATTTFGQATLRDLSLTSRRFRSLAQPVLFHRFRCEVEFPTSVGPAISRVQHILELLQNRPETRFWFIDFCATLPPIRTFYEVQGVVSKIEQLANLLAQFVLYLEAVRRFVWSMGLLPSLVHERLYRMPTLKRLYLVGLLTIDDVQSEPLQRSATTFWYLKVDTGRSILPDDEAASRVSRQQRQLLQRFTFVSTITHLETQLCIMDAGPSPLLEGGESPYTGLSHLVLELTATEAPGLPSVLAACPNLRTLHIAQCFGNNPSAPLRVPYDAVPVLEEISGPLYYVEALMCRRPLRTVSVRFPLYKPSLTEDEIAVLAQGSVDVVKLELDCLRWSDELLLIIVKILPNLESLTIKGFLKFNYMNLLQDVVKSNLVLPRLRHIRFSAPRIMEMMFPDHSSAWETHSFDDLDSTISDLSEAEEAFNELRENFRDAVLGWLTISGESFPSLASAQFQSFSWRRGDGGGSWSMAGKD